MKRSSGYYYAVAHPSSSSNDAASNKRRRQRQELNYTAATIQRALTNAGRPPVSVMARNRRERALPMGSVDMGGARMMTSAEFDALDNDDNEVGDASSQRENDLQAGAETKSEDRTETVSSADNRADEYDISSMYMLSGLIQSTRHYYNFSNDNSDATTATASVNNTSSNIINYRPARNGKATQLTQSYNSACNDEKLSEDNSEGLSSWTPSSSYNSLNDNERKDIDNYNRSDGQSSDMGAGRENSAGDEIESSDSNSITSSESQRVKGSDDEEDYGGAELRRESYASLDGLFTIIG
jgi:hypothetical protein